MAAARIALRSVRSADQRTGGGPGLNDDLAGGPDAVPGGAAQLDAHRPLATPVQMDRGWPFGIGQVGVTPTLERREQRKQLSTGVGQVILAASPLAGLAIVSAFEQPDLDQTSQAPAEHGLRDPEVLLDVGKSMQPPEHLAQDLQHPRLTDDVDGPPDAAVSGVLISPLHSSHYTGFR